MKRISKYLYIISLFAFLVLPFSTQAAFPSFSGFDFSGFDGFGGYGVDAPDPDAGSQDPPVIDPPQEPSIEIPVEPPQEDTSPVIPIPPVFPDSIYASGFSAVSIAFDDGLLSTYTKALPVMESEGLRGTVYVYPEVQVQKAMGGGYEEFMSWDNVRSLQNEYDWEIGAHSYSHAHLTQVSRRDMMLEIKLALHHFIKQGIHALGFASPYGEYNDDVLAYVSRYHSYHRTAFGGTFNDISTLNDYALNAVEVAFDMEPAEAKALIDQAILENKWLILYFHELVDGDPDPYEYNTAKFEEIVSYLAEQNTNVLPVREVLEKWNSLDDFVVNGDFEEGTGSDAIGWTRNDFRRVSVVNTNKGNAPEPKRSVRLRGSAHQVQISSDSILVDDSKSYLLRMFSKMLRFRAGSGNVWISEFDENGAYIGGKWLGDFTSDGVQMRYLEYSPNPGTASIEIFFYAEAGSKFTWYIDDISLVKNPF